MSTPLLPYADAPTRRVLQVLADVAALVALVLAYRAAWAVHDTIARLAEPGQRLREAGSGLAGNLDGAATSTGDLPLVGGPLSSALRGAAGAAGDLAAAGQDLQDRVGAVAAWAGIATFGVPVLVLVAFWLVPRIRFTRRAAAVRRYLAAGTYVELFALRAITRGPLPALARVSPDPVGAWRRGDADVVRRLADLELAAAGVRPPARPDVAVGPSAL